MTAVMAEKVDTIMRNENAIVKSAQSAIRTELDRRGIALKLIASKADVPYSTLVSWFPNPCGGKEPQIMGLDGLYKLAGHIPDELLSLLLPDTRHIVSAPEGVDYDEFARGCRSYLQAKDDAHHPNSPAGRDLSDCERENLTALHLHVRGG